MVDSRLWRYVLFSSITELAIILIVAIILIAIYPTLFIYITIGAICALIITIVIHYYIYKPIFAHKAIDPQEELIGQEGTALTDLTPRGQVKLRHEVWSAHSTSGTIQAGSKIKVIQVEGIQLIVQQI